MATIKTQIALRRDSESNYNAVQSTFKPLKGEICFVETTKGLKIKVGDGSNTFSNLKYIDEDNVYKYNILQGYYNAENFYEDLSYTKSYEGDSHKIYIDKSNGKFYYWHNNKFQENIMSIPNATSERPGILKIYETQGQNTDGAVTQKFFTEALNGLVLTVDDEDPTCLVLSKLW